jgi:hypothetical protein
LACREGGTCVEKPECSISSECDDLNECTTNACVLGMCEFTPNDGAECDAGGQPGLCEAAACVGLCEGANCPDLGECMVNECNPSNGDCEASPVGDGTPCDGGNGTCQAGVCEPAGPPTYDLSLSVFKPYNSLLDPNTGTGNFATDCAVPDLSGNPGANLTGITAKCIIITPPDINGTMVLDETSPGNFDVTVTQNLSFNINAAATGITNCTATNLATGVDVSDAICPLAGLMGGDNPLPFAGDPFMRTFPPIAVGASTFALGAGPADPTGWYLSNPPALAGNGTQWVGLSGVLQ